MNCKFCNAELEEGLTLCPTCGKENAEDTPAEVVIPEAVTEETLDVAAEESNEETAEEITEEATETVTEEAQEVPVQKTALWIKILAAIGVLALLAVLVGAVYYGVNKTPKAESYTVSAQKADKVRDTVVATVGDYNLTNDALQVFYWQCVEEFNSYYGAYMDTSVLDLEKPLDTQFYNEESGITWQMHFLDSALATWSRYAALCMQAKEAGFEMSEEAQAQLDSVPQRLEDMAVSYGYETAAQMLTEDMGAISTVDGYMDFITINYYAGDYLDSIYDSLMPTDDEIEAYYAQNEEMLNMQGISKDSGSTVDARHILICPKGGTEDENGTVTYSEEEWEQCRQDAQKILDAWDGTEDGFAQLATAYTEDPGSMATGGLYTDIYEGQMVPEFNDWCFDESRAYGDTGLVQTTYGYHIMFFVDSQEIWVANVRDLIISDNSMAIVNEAALQWPMDANYKKVALGEKSVDAE